MSDSFWWGLFFFVLAAIFTIAAVYFDKEIKTFREKRSLSSKNKNLKTLLSEYRQAKHFHSNRNDFYLVIVKHAISFVTFYTLVILSYVILILEFVGFYLLGYWQIPLVSHSFSNGSWLNIISAVVGFLIGLVGLAVIIWRHSLSKDLAIISRIRNFQTYESNTLRRIAELKGQTVEEVVADIQKESNWEKTKQINLEIWNSSHGKPK